MDIRELMNESMIEVGAELRSKDEAIDRLILLQKNSGAIHNPYALLREIREREAQGNTAVSARIAIPAVMHTGAIRTTVSALTVRSGVDYGAPDNRPVKLIFMIAGRSGTEEHIEVRTRLMHLLMDSEFAARLCAVRNTEEFLRLISEREKIRYAPPIPQKKYDCSKYLLQNKRKKRFFR